MRRSTRLGRIGYAHLLGSVEEFYKGEAQWVQFDSNFSKQGLDAEHRESVSTQDSDLNPRYAMQAETGSRDDLASFGAAIDHVTSVKPGLSVLAIPARSRRAAKHLRKPEFLLNAFPMPRTPTTITGATLSPRSPRFAPFQISVRAKGKARRRPAPLTLTPPSPARKRALNPADADQMRKEFLQDSFSPRPRVLVGAAGQPIGDAVQEKIAARPSIANMKGMFRAIGNKKANAA